MLSYRHAFHAGNHADVLKHFILLQLLDYLNQKDKPYIVIDTHAGAGLYSLDTGYAQQGAEYMQGIAKLWDVPNLPAPLQTYVAAVRQLNPQGALKAYPGSPWLALQAIRESDRLRLFELHSTDARLLHDNFAAAGRRVKVEFGDGFAGMRALLPPPSRRGLVLIDPSYEDKEDYRTVHQAIKDAMQRFATGMYAVWYPLLPRPEPQRMVDNIMRLEGVKCLDVVLQVRAPTSDGLGMYGSGMLLVNPPYTLAPMLRATLPTLVKLMGLDRTAGYRLQGSK
ncbi:MAG: 23S rRNA (adenine(2030)-N(6))-methyltransferase RlmJ [Betaproteobacteria bacterium]|nr:23S rRNA (adenine(2030)-N(6))-methyltransferase RlmJ [Betaproteobacteria bacterium]